MPVWVTMTLPSDSDYLAPASESTKSKEKLASSWLICKKRRPADWVRVELDLEGGWSTWDPQKRKVIVWKRIRNYPDHTIQETTHYLPVMYVDRPRRSRVYLVWTEARSRYKERKPTLAIQWTYVCNKLSETSTIQAPWVSYKCHIFSFSATIYLHLAAQLISR